VKIQYIASASVVVEHEGVRVLCDPWLTDGIYYGTWYHYPPLQCKPEDFADVDYIYISHIHPDHMDQETLKRLPRSIPILIHNYQDKFILRILSGLGFETIIEVEHKQCYQLAPDFMIEILAADNCDPEVCGKYFGCAVPDPYQRTIQIDSIAVFYGGGKTVVNTNDCQYELSYGVCDYIRDKYEKIDYLLSGYLSATSYPQCYENLDHAAKLKRATEIQIAFLNKTINYIKRLNALVFQPFAGQYVLGGKQWVLNAYRSVPEMEELPEKFTKLLEEHKLTSRLVLLNSMEFFDLDSMQPSAAFVPPNPQNRRRYIEGTLAGKKYIYEEQYRIKPEAWIDLTERLEEARQRMERYQEKAAYNSDWKVYLDVGQEELYTISFDKTPVYKIKPGMEQIPFIGLGLDYSLLVMILNRQAHWNNVDLSSHLRIYRQPDVYEKQVYMLLSYLHC